MLKFYYQPLKLRIFIQGIFVVKMASIEELKIELKVLKEELENEKKN